MTCVRCRIVLAEGRYERAATPVTVRDTLRWVLFDSLWHLEFADPEEDVAVDGEAAVLLKSRFRDWGDEEALCDRIAMALAARLQPEYESMIEVELLEVGWAACFPERTTV